MLVENYPVGWALDTRKPEPYAAYLIDIPGLVMQGRTLAEAVTKLRAIVPIVFAVYRQEGAVFPQPSAEPSLEIGDAKWDQP